MTPVSPHARLVLAAALALLAALAGCHRAGPPRAADSQLPPASSPSAERPTVEVRHATGFRIEPLAEGWLLRVTRPWPGATEDATYALLPRGSALPSSAPPATRRIETPVTRVVALATPHIAMLELLEARDALVGIETARYVSNEAVRAAAAEGRIAEVGSGPTIDLERLVSLEPETVLCSSFGDASQDSDAKLVAAGLPAVLIGDYAEETALGRAEWVKVVGLLLGREAKANEVFDAIERDYTALALRARQAEPKPTVLLNTDFEGTWYVPGGSAYEAKLLADAGARYLWADDPSSGALPLGIEAVLDKGQDADVWLNPGTYPSLEALARADSRYRAFRAFREGKVYGHTARVTETGAQDFWETGACRPDLVLRDLVRILHPDLLPDHSLIWYRQLS